MTEQATEREPRTHLLTGSEDDYDPFLSAHEEAVGVIRITAARYAAEVLPDMPGIRRIKQNHLAVVEAMLRIADEAQNQRSRDAAASEGTER